MLFERGNREVRSPSSIGGDLGLMSAKRIQVLWRIDCCNLLNPDTSLSACTCFPRWSG